MGWASGSQLGEEMWDFIRKYIPQKDHKKVARRIYDMFCEHDADDWSQDSNLCKDAGCHEEYE